MFLFTWEYGRPAFGPSCYEFVYPGCWQFNNAATSKIDWPGLEKSKKYQTMIWNKKKYHLTLKPSLILSGRSARRKVSALRDPDSPPHYAIFVIT